MPEEMQLIECGNCHKQAHGLYSTAATRMDYIAGFYNVKSGSAWHRYQANKQEAFLCKPCLHTRMREERRSLLP